MSSPENALPLEVVPQGTPIAWTGKEIRELSHLEADTAYRRTRLFSFGFSTLIAALEAADVMFDEIASDCNADVPEHHWKLARKPASKGPTAPDDRLIPLGYDLVAEVDVIRDVRQLNTTEQAAVNGLLLAYRLSDSPAIWLHPTADSLAYGVRRKDGRSGLWLFDFEPFIMAKSYRAQE